MSILWFLAISFNVSIFSLYFKFYESNYVNNELTEPIVTEKNMTPIIIIKIAIIYSVLLVAEISP